MSLGKSAVGLIEVKAFHQGGNVVIEVSDDGGGLSKDGILKKAAEKGILKGNTDDMSDREVYNLIFVPGFSTASEVTEISGRGVGLDVVRKNVEMLRGRVDLTSEIGVGTTFSIKLPLTLAIIDGMVLRVGTENYIVPTLSVERSLRPAKEDISSVGGKGELVKVRDELYPVIRLSHVFDQTENVIQDPTEATLILVESEGKKFCLMVDEIVEHQQVVIKSLGEKFKNLEGVSGCSILGDGKVALIVDISGLLTFLDIS